MRGFKLSRESLIALLVFGLASLGFYAFPELDMAAAKALYLDKGKFLLSDSQLSTVFHKPVDQFLKYAFLGGLLIYLALLAARVKIRASIKEKLNFIYLSAFSSVVLIINGLLKDFWGRARPSQITEFGGQAEFTPAWTITDQCHSNCAFVSGHAGMAASVALLAAFLPPRWRKLYLAAALMFYAAASFMRMARGAHFLSDVVIAGMIVWVAAMVVRDTLKLRF